MEREERERPTAVTVKDASKRAGTTSLPTFPDALRKLC